jgi:hypothetical protein
MRRKEIARPIMVRKNHKWQLKTNEHKVSRKKNRLVIILTHISSHKNNDKDYEVKKWGKHKL